MWSYGVSTSSRTCLATSLLQHKTAAILIASKAKTSVRARLQIHHSTTPPSTLVRERRVAHHAHRTTALAHRPQRLLAASRLKFQCWFAS